MCTQLIRYFELNASLTNHGYSQLQNASINIHYPGQVNNTHYNVDDGYNIIRFIILTIQYCVFTACFDYYSPFSIKCIIGLLILFMCLFKKSLVI